MGVLSIRKRVSGISAGGILICIEGASYHDLDSTPAALSKVAAEASISDAGIAPLILEPTVT